MRFQFQAADVLRNREEENEGIEQVDVIDDKKVCFRRIETRGTARFHLGARETHGVAAKRPLRTDRFARIEKNGEKHEKAADGKEIGGAQVASDKDC